MQQNKMSERTQAKLAWAQVKSILPLNIRKETKTIIPLQKKKKDSPAKVNMGKSVPEYLDPKYYGKPATTMTGLPWSVRHKPARMRYSASRLKKIIRPRMGNYTFTYGLGENETGPGAHQAKPIVKPLSLEVDIPQRVKHFIATKSGIKNNLAETGYTPSLHKIMKQTGNTLSPTESSRDISALDALWTDKKSYLSLKASDSLSPSELEEAARAFDLHGLPKPSYPQANKFPSKGPINGSKKKVRLPEPSSEVFQQSYRLLPHIQEKLIEDQVKKEFAARKMAPIGSEYIKRKHELMKAALQVQVGFAEDDSSEDVFPDLIDEYDVKELFRSRDEDVQEIKNPVVYTSSQENPKRHIQMLSPLRLETKDIRLRQGQRESLMGTVLREVEESKNQLAIDGFEEKELSPRRRTKDQERNRQLALRALENYRLIQERQKDVIHRVPQVTVRRHGQPSEIPRGSEYHQMALSHTHRSHAPKQSTMLNLASSRFPAPEQSFETKYSNMDSRNQYPTHSRGISPLLPPPISDSIVAGKK